MARIQRREKGLKWDRRSDAGKEKRKKVRSRSSYLTSATIVWGNLAKNHWIPVRGFRSAPVPMDYR